MGDYRQNISTFHYRIIKKIKKAARGGLLFKIIYFPLQGVLLLSSLFR
jgi:hypothetical protein